MFAFFFVGIAPPPSSTLFPYTTLFRSKRRMPTLEASAARVTSPASARAASPLARANQDRKSTRLNSSHRCISYAVFCLKKKKEIMQLLYLAAQTQNNWDTSKQSTAAAL